MAEKKFNINPLYEAKEKKLKPLDYYVNGILQKNHNILSEAITLVESTEPMQKKLGIEILESLPNEIGRNTVTIAITGSPGAGKSTFIEKFGKYLLDQDLRLGILAVDPTSYIYNGSILADKTRMDYLSQHPSAYIRPTSAGSTLGGIARGTKDAITLCKAAGYDYIFIETVGVGQSEYWASNITDLTICLLQPGAGDETQGIKRGLLEMSDILLITKTDGELQELALKAAQSYTTSIQLFPEKINGLSRYVLNTSSINNLGFDVILDTIREIVKYLKENNIFHARRNEQEVAWFLLTMKDNILDAVLSNQDLKAKWEELQKEIYTQNINASIATKEFISYLETFIKK